MNGFQSLPRLVKRHRAKAAVPFAMGVTGLVLGLGVTTGSVTGPDPDLDIEAIVLATKGQFNAAGLEALSARLSPGQLVIAQRHDPALGSRSELRLTPGWESLSLGGKPSLDAVLSGLRAQQLNAATPTEDGALQPAQAFDLRAATDLDRQRALRCLTQAVYYEAALEPTEGQAAVAQVVLNRVRDPNYPSSVCGVVYQGAERVTGCQFTFTCDGSLARVPTPWAWNRAKAVAERALSGAVSRRVGTATHYHADYVRPYWAPSLAKIDQIGAHIFYRWKGRAGESAAFTDRATGREPVINEALFAQPRLAPVPEIEADVGLAQSDYGLLTTGDRRVDYEGTSRIVGAPSLGGRRQASAEEIAAINARLKAFEEGAVAATTPATPTPQS